jgi:hypothetical protein
MQYVADDGGRVVIKRIAADNVISNHCAVSWGDRLKGIHVVAATREPEVSSLSAAEGGENVK